MTSSEEPYHHRSWRIATFFVFVLQIAASDSLSSDAFQSSLSRQSRVSKTVGHRNTRLFISFEDAMANADKPKPKKKRRRRKDKMKKNKGTSKLEKVKNTPVDSDELAQHVSSMYMRGPGGKMRQVDFKRKRMEASSKLEVDMTEKEHRDYMHKLDRHPALVLNADFQPLSVLPLSLWSWQETVKSLFNGKVQTVEIYSDINVRAVNMNVPLPSVIALTEYVHQPHQRPAFTRRNVFLRDGYVCQYCGNKFKTQDLSLDHVTPRCVGGRLTWDNTVTCCKKCNGRKGSTLPSDLYRVKGMKLIREPRVPTKLELAREAEKMVPRSVHPTWRPYLGLGMEPNGGGLEGSGKSETTAENE